MFAAFPESFARRLGQVVEINPVPVTCSGIASKLLPLNTLLVIHLSVKDAVRIVDVRPPECRLGGGRINRQSDLPAPLDFRFVFVNVGQSVIVDLLQSFAGFRYLPSGLVDRPVVSRGSPFWVFAEKASTSSAMASSWFLLTSL